MAAAATDYFTEVGSPGTATTLAAPGHIIAGTAITVVATSNWPTTTGVIFAMDTVTIVDGEEVRDVGTYTEWEGVVASATSITGMILRVGTDQNYPAGSTTRVYIPVAATKENRNTQGILVDHKQDGHHKLSANYDPSNLTLETQKWAGVASAVNELTATNAATGNNPSLSATGDDSNIGLDLTPKGTGAVRHTKRYDPWVSGLTAPSTVTALGNRSYSVVINTTDYTDRISPGTRVRLTRTVAAPTQCTSLNGTTQYFVKTSPNKLTFTNNFVVSAWVKLASYPTDGTITSRYNGTSGWQFDVTSTGQVRLLGFNGGAANFSLVTCYQSIPLNKWVHITAQLDMLTFTASTTTSYMMIDGVDVPCSVARGGTAPTALIQAGNLEIGSANGGTFLFPGKIAQVAIYNAKVTQATILASMHQTLAGTETSLASAYSFNNAVTDLNTTTPNDLSVGGGSAVATNTDSPFGGQADGTVSSTLEYGIVLGATFSTNTTLTVFCPEGCAIPTTGGVTALAYSSSARPYGFRGNGRVVWQNLLCANATASGTTPVLVSGLSITTPALTAGTKLVASFQAAYVYNGTATTNSFVGIHDGAVGTTTQLVRGGAIAPTGNTGSQMNIVTPEQTVSGAKTYNVSEYSSGATSVGIEASATSPVTLTVEAFV